MSLGRHHLVICQSPGCIQCTDQIQTPEKTQASPSSGCLSCPLSRTSSGRVPGRRPCEPTISRTHSSSEQRKPAIEPSARRPLCRLRFRCSHTALKYDHASQFCPWSDESPLDSWGQQAYTLLNKEATLSQGCFQAGSLNMSTRLTRQMSGSPVPADAGSVHADSTRLDMTVADMQAEPRLSGI